MSHLGILLASDHYPQVRASDTIDRQLTQWLASLGHDITRVSTFEKIGQQGRWLQVRSTDDGNTGWMFGDYLTGVN